MNNVFPSISTISIKEGEAGSIARLSRSGGSILALLTDHITNGVRSIVWLNSKGQNRSVVFVENWRNDEDALRYNDDIRFELGMADDQIDPKAQHSWETPGVIVSIGDELFIRATPQDNFYGGYRLVNIRTGALFPNQPPNYMWSFLSWRLFLQNSTANQESVLMEFAAPSAVGAE